MSFSSRMSTMPQRKTSESDLVKILTPTLTLSLIPAWIRGKMGMNHGRSSRKMRRRRRRWRRLRDEEGGKERERKSKDQFIGKSKPDNLYDLFLPLHWCASITNNNNSGFLYTAYLLLSDAQGALTYSISCKVRGTLFEL